MQRSSFTSGAAFARAIEWRLWRRNVAANLIGFTMLLVFVGQSAPFFETRRPFLEIFERTLLFGIGCCVVFAVLGMTLVRWRFRHVRRWLTEEREPTPAERRSTIRQPLLQASFGILFWIAGALVTYTATRSDITWGTVILTKMVIGFLGWGLFSAALTYLLVEAALRPLLPDVLGPETTMGGGVESILTRLLLSGLVGSGWVLVGLLTILVGSTPQQRANASSAIFTAIVMGVVASLLLTLFAARSVSEPLRGIKAAMRRAAAGDLDITLPLDDATEVGQLQAGFNHMLSGLRERERIRDLFGRHVGDEVVAVALQSEPGLGEEARSVSVLFVDIIGSTALAQSRPTKEVLTMLNGLYDAVVRTVGVEGGWVNRFVGDAALCVFGAPAPQPDHAERALRAARLLHCELVGLTEQHPGFRAAIGVSSGEVVAGNVGTASRYEYTVIGDPVNEAARLCDEAKRHDDPILASARAIRTAPAEARHWFESGRYMLRGRSRPTTAYTPTEPT